MDLSTLKPNKGARQRSVRVGRGEASGCGKTSGRGGKGQTARAGGTIRRGFEGGQMPLVRRLGKLGFRSRQKTLGTNQYNIINLSDLERFDAGTKVDKAALQAIGITVKSSKKAGIKVLGGGSLTKKITVVVDAVTASARTKIESAGGTVDIIKQ